MLDQVCNLLLSRKKLDQLFMYLGFCHKSLIQHLNYYRLLLPLFQGPLPVFHMTNSVWIVSCWSAFRESSINSPRSPLKSTMVIQDDSLPAAPPPQIRILKRPTSNGSLGSPLNQNRPTPQVKSLAQREAEYAEARKRILGSACPEEMPQDKPNTDR